MAHCSYIFIYGNPREDAFLLACLKFLVNHSAFVIFANRFSLQCVYVCSFLPFSPHGETDIGYCIIETGSLGLLITRDIVITHIQHVTVTGDT